MKKKIIIALTMMTGCLLDFSNGQTGVQIMKPKYIMTYEPTSVLESGIDNVLHITVGDTSVKRLLINSSQGTVKQQGDDFIIHPDLKGEILLKIYNNNDLINPVLIEERKLEVAAGPFASLGGKQGGKISKEELNRVTRVEVNGVEDAKVCEYKLSVAGKGVDYKEFVAKDENLTGEMIAALQQLAVGTKIYIEYIRVGKANRSRQVSPLAFTVFE